MKVGRILVNDDDVDEVIKVLKETEDPYAEYLAEGLEQDIEFTNEYFKKQMAAMEEQKMKVTNYKRVSDSPIEYEITFEDGNKVTTKEPCSLCDNWDLTDGYDEQCIECCHFYGDRFKYEEH